MSALPTFKLRNLPQALPYDHVRASESTPGDRSRNAGAVPPQSSSGHLARCLAWAQASGHCFHSSQLAARFDGRQVSAELFEQFRASPEFGRSLFERVEPYLNPDSMGDLLLIDAGGEAVVFGDADLQKVIKLFAPPNSGGFGYVLAPNAKGRWEIRGGELVESLYRFAWFEACFGSGLELDALGTEADFVTLSQPFYVGRRPCEDELEEWMKACGWEPWSPPTDQATVAQHTWRRDDFVATDVVTRNAIVAEADERLRAIDLSSPTSLPNAHPPPTHPLNPSTQP